MRVGVRLVGVQSAQSNVRSNTSSGTVPKVPVDGRRAVEGSTIEVYSGAIPLAYIWVVLQLVDLNAKELQNIGKEPGGPGSKGAAAIAGAAAHVHVRLATVGWDAYILEKPDRWGRRGAGMPVCSRAH